MSDAINCLSTKPLLIIIFHKLSLSLSSHLCLYIFSLMNTKFKPLLLNLKLFLFALTIVPHYTLCIKIISLTCESVRATEKLQFETKTLFAKKCFFIYIQQLRRITLMNWNKKNVLYCATRLEKKILMPLVQKLRQIRLKNRKKKYTKDIL